MDSCIGDLSGDREASIGSPMAQLLQDSLSRLWFLLGGVLTRGDSPPAGEDPESSFDPRLGDAVS